MIPTFNSTIEALDFAERATPEEIQKIAGRLAENKSRSDVLEIAYRQTFAGPIDVRRAVCQRLVDVLTDLQFDHECLNHAKVAA